MTKYSNLIQIALRSHNSRYLSATQHRGLTLTQSRRFNELWTPGKNEDGSWSFRSAHGTWLRARPDGVLSLQNAPKTDEHFWLEPGIGVSAVIDASTDSIPDKNLVSVCWIISFFLKLLGDPSSKMNTYWDRATSFLIFEAFDITLHNCIHSDW